MLAKSKLDSIEALVSQALIDLKISREEFITILKEKINMRRWKKIWKTVIEKLEEKAENMRLNSVNSIN